ncbi:MAG: hypothetical protein AB7V32_06630 [Candidatus Berkiella sp.]
MFRKIILKSYILMLALFFQTARGATLNTADIAVLKPKLNSERIAYLFGSYGVEPLNVCESLFPDSRISNLYSLHDGNKVLRTFAIVDFAKQIEPSLQAAHQEILKGGSIGTTLKNAHWEIHKQPLYVGEIALTPPLMKLMQEHNNLAAMYIYELNVKKAAQDSYIPYCRIIEIYSPQYIDMPLLKAFNNTTFEAPLKTNDEINQLLSQVKQCLNTLPR